jgi:hypothetical protein
MTWSLGKGKRYYDLGIERLRTSASVGQWQEKSEILNLFRDPLCHISSIWYKNSWWHFWSN